MHDLIYRDDLIKSLPVDWPTTVLAIEEAPAVDAVEVVRCRECKYHNDTSVTEYEHCCLIGQTVRYDDFCSYGVRKEGAG